MSTIFLDGGEQAGMVLCCGHMLLFFFSFDHGPKRHFSACVSNPTHASTGQPVLFSAPLLSFSPCARAG